jgi:hypothetical protein
VAGASKGGHPIPLGVRGLDDGRKPGGLASDVDQLMVEVVDSDGSRRWSALLGC